MDNVTAILSMLHEGPATDGTDGRLTSATRRFRNKPVIDWTLMRLTRLGSIDSISILCWDDQQSALEPVNARHPTVQIVAKGARHALPGMNAITTARRWADGWRGGLLGTCEFDLGFHPE